MNVAIQKHASVFLTTVFKHDPVSRLLLLKLKVCEYLLCTKFIDC